MATLQTLRSLATQVKDATTGLEKQLGGHTTFLRDLELSCSGLDVLAGEGDLCDSNTIKKVLDRISEVEGHLHKAVQALGKTNSASIQLCTLCRQFADMAISLLEQQSRQLDKWAFLSRYRDHIRSFRTHVAKDIGLASWDDLSSQLLLEECLPEDQQELVLAIKNYLESIGMTWQDWTRLRQIADASNYLMHCPEGITVALEGIDDVPIPEALQECRESLKKALQYLTSKAKALSLNRTKVRITNHATCADYLMLLIAGIYSDAVYVYVYMPVCCWVIIAFTMVSGNFSRRAR
jgi:hypothetical protein